MQDISNGILETIEQARVKLKLISDEDASIKEKPAAWSKKEITGHLIDSASNNHQRFIRAIQNLAENFPAYNQNEWVAAANYNEMEWEKLVDLFYHYNWMLANVIKDYPEEALFNPCSIGKDNPVTIEFVIKDYLRHLKHHVDKLLQ